MLSNLSTSGGGRFEKGDTISAEHYEKLIKHSPELAKFFEKKVVSKTIGGGTKITKKQRKAK